MFQDQNFHIYRAVNIANIRSTGDGCIGKYYFNKCGSNVAANTISFANFICRSGNDKDSEVLLDIAIDVVIPALQDTKYLREHGETRYFFLDVALTDLGSQRSPDPILAGRFVKDTVLTREQVFKDGDLVPSFEELESAPSAFFVLHLAHHRLVYMAETSHAPSMQAFSATARSFVRLKYEEWIRQVKKNEESQGRTTSLKSIRAQHPQPNIVVIPLTSDDEISTFIKKYDRLTKIEFIVGRTNEEFDAEEMLNAIGESRDRLNADRTSLVHRNKDGLDKQEAIAEIKKATKTGNRQVVTDGYNHDGDRMSGTNEHFKLSLKASVPEERPAREEKLAEIYKSHIASGSISVGQQTRDTRNILGAIAKLFGPSR